MGGNHLGRWAESLRTGRSHSVQVRYAVLGGKGGGALGAQEATPPEMVSVQRLVFTFVSVDDVRDLGVGVGGAHGVGRAG